MTLHKVRTHAEGDVLPRSEQLAWKMAELATAERRVDDEAVTMVGNRLLDNAAVALGAINRDPVRHARLLALGYEHPQRRGAALFGLPSDRTFH